MKNARSAAKKSRETSKETARRTNARRPAAQAAKPGDAAGGGASGDTGDWRGTLLARIRVLIKEAEPEAIEEIKWRKPSNGMRGVPVWSHPTSGMICTGEIYKSVVKLTFAKGASLKDPAGLFNASLEGNTRRAIDFREGDAIDEGALKALVRAAVALSVRA